jgi:REP element-mobilizing transposase RayT
MPILASVSGRELRPTRSGRLVIDCWERIEVVHAGRVRLDAFVVMPDHLHGILFLESTATGGSPATLSTIIGGFKAASARAIRRDRPNLPAIWQRSFHDRVIRSESELVRIRQYIEDNPIRWLERRG